MCDFGFCIGTVMGTHFMTCAFEVLMSMCLCVHSRFLCLCVCIFLFGHFMGTHFMTCL